MYITQVIHYLIKKKNSLSIKMKKVSCTVIPSCIVQLSHPAILQIFLWNICSFLLWKFRYIWDNL